MWSGGKLKYSLSLDKFLRKIWAIVIDYGIIKPFAILTHMSTQDSNICQAKNNGLEA